MAGVETRGNLFRALQEGARLFFDIHMKDYSPEYTMIFQELASEKAYEEDVSNSGLGLGYRKPEGSPIRYDENGKQGFLTRYEHDTYALGFQITREAIEDNLYMNLVQKRSEQLKRSMMHTVEHLAANVINRGYNTDYTGGDGQTLFSNAHPFIHGGTYANILPTAAQLSEAALEDAIIAISKYQDDRGLITQQMATRLVVPTDLQFVADRILMTPMRTGTANNDINAIRETGAIAMDYVINHRFTSTENWFLLTDAEEGLTTFERRALALDNDNDFDTENFRAKATFRRSFGWTNPRAVFGSGNIV